MRTIAGKWTTANWSDPTSSAQDFFGEFGPWEPLLHRGHIGQVVWSDPPAHWAALARILVESIPKSPSIPSRSIPRLVHDRELEELREWCKSEIQRETRALREELGLKGGPSSQDPVSEWVATHPEELARYRGKRVAIHATHGVVAHGDDLASVYDIVRKRGLLDEVVFDSIPNS